MEVIASASVRNIIGIFAYAEMKVAAPAIRTGAALSRGPGAIPAIRGGDNIRDLLHRLSRLGFHPADLSHSRLGRVCL
jgi:hypothetical protein